MERNIWDYRAAGGPGLSSEHPCMPLSWPEGTLAPTCPHPPCALDLKAAQSPLPLPHCGAPTVPPSPWSSPFPYWTTVPFQDSCHHLSTSPRTGGGGGDRLTPSIIAWSCPSSPKTVYNILLKDVLPGHASHSSLSAPGIELPSFILKIHHYKQHKTQESLATLLFHSFTFTTPHQPQPSMWQNPYSEQTTQTTATLSFSHCPGASTASLLHLLSLLHEKVLLIFHKTHTYTFLPCQAKTPESCIQWLPTYR